MARLYSDSSIFYIEIRTFWIVWLTKSLQASSSQLVNKQAKIVVRLVKKLIESSRVEPNYE
jgi:hypothetical protein